MFTKETLNDLPALGVSSVNCPVVTFASSVFIHHFCRVSILHGDMSQSSCFFYLPSKDNISWFLGEWCKFTSKNNYKGVKYFHSHIMNPSCSLDAHIQWSYFLFKFPLDLTFVSFGGWTAFLIHPLAGKMGKPSERAGMEACFNNRWSLEPPGKDTSGYARVGC